MPTYEIEQIETWTRTVHVEAAGKAEAVKKLLDGGDVIEAGLELDGVNSDLGMWTDEHPELTEKLKALGVYIDSDVIPGIRSIKKI